MQSPSQLEPLSRRQRRIIFILSILLFLITVPLLVFYAIGYRVDFSDAEQNIRTVGGMYVSTENPDSEIFINDEPVENMRLFQNAAYIQNVSAGQHQVHVQGDGLTTWVKELPVYSHLVTEANSFNMPASSTVRFVSPQINDLGNPVYDKVNESLRPFVQATTSQTIIFATSSNPVLGNVNPEFSFLETIFASTTEDRALLAQKESFTPDRFSFTAPPVFGTTTASSTRVVGDVALAKEGADLFVYWRGDKSDIPFYFCVFSSSYETIASDYGSHVVESIFSTSTSTLATTTFAKNNQLCRTQISIDRKWQSVIWFEFMPGEPSLVLLQLQAGIYVVEIDDRSWQNVQQLYAGDNLTMLINGQQIFVRDGDIYFELLTDPLTINN